MYNMTCGILLSQFLVQNKTNIIKSSLHAECNGTSHSFIPPTTAVKKLKAPRKHPPKLMNLCCISQWEGITKIMKIAWSVSYVQYDLGNFVISTSGSEQNKLYIIYKLASR